MKNIVNIAKAEIRYFFYSPIAWFVLVIYTFAAAAMVMLNLNQYAVQQENLLELQGKLFEGFKGDALTGSILGRGMSIASNMFSFLLPLLTMSVVNRETSGGTIKLLSSAPVRVREIVLGKFLGIYTIVVLMIACSGTAFTTVACTIVNADVPHILSMFIAYLLLGALYTALGVFISSLTSYAIVAAILTFVGILLLTLMNGMFQGYDYVRSVTYFLGTSNRFDTIFSGLITSKDFLYFSTMTGLFLILTVIRMKAYTESRSWMERAFRYLLTISMAIVILLLTSIHAFIGYWDLTKNNRHTLHPNSQEVFKRLDGSELKVTIYSNVLGDLYPSMSPQHISSTMHSFFPKYTRFYDNLNIDFVFHYDMPEEDTANYLKNFPGKSVREVAEKMAENYSTRWVSITDPTTIPYLPELRKQATSTMRFEYKGKSAYAQFFRDPLFYPDEQQITAAIQRILVDTVPAFNYLIGHYERSPFKTGERELSFQTIDIDFRESLRNRGIDVDTITEVRSDLFTSKHGLIVSDPKVAFKPRLLDSIKAYLARGGNAMFFAEPGKQNILNPILNQIGINIEPGMVVKPNDHDLPNKYSFDLSPAIATLADERGFYLYKIGMQKVLNASMIGASHITIDRKNDFKYTVYANKPHDQGTWIENGHLVLDSAKPIFLPVEGDLQINTGYNHIIGLEREINGKTQKIFVSGDADYTSNLRRDDMVLAFYSYLTDNEFPVYHNLPPNLDISLRINKIQSRIIHWVTGYALPLAIAILGIILLIRRKRK